MKSRITLALLVLGVLLAPRPGASESPSMLSSVTPDCAAAPSPSLPSLLAEVSAKSLPSLPKCGTCSQTICRGATLGSQCGVGGGGVILHCVDTGTCSADSLTSCACSSGPIF